MIGVAREFAAGSLGLAAIDFERNGYTVDVEPGRRARTCTRRPSSLSAWEVSVADPALAARWAALGVAAARHARPQGLGAVPSAGLHVPRVTRIGAAACSRSTTGCTCSPTTAPPSSRELEVFAFIARANDDMRAFSLLAMVISLFETGYLRTGAGLFEYSTGHLSGNRDVAVRLADAMRRGALCRDTATGHDSVDYLRVDWFAVAPLAARTMPGIGSPSSRNRPRRSRAGSVGPWEPGGISPFQINAGRELANRLERPYESYGATPE